MLSTILSQLIALCVAAAANILIGAYNNVKIDECNFCIKKFLTGIIKAAIIIFTFIAIGYCFDATDLSSIGVTPDLIINSAIILYITKATQNLIKILGITGLSVNSAPTNTVITDAEPEENASEPVTFEDSVG